MSVASEGISNSNNTCIVCYKNVEYYSIGMCEHPVCYECSTRMRVLCQQNECPICRQGLPKVVFTKEIKPFRFLRKGNLLDIKYNIYFDNHEIQEKFMKLLAHTCTVCDVNQKFSSFNYLKDHVKRKHDLHYCELCVDNLKIFSYERRCYTGPELSRHQREGDVDDKSHKGHPLCKFCEQRYMDIDELYRHLRRDHLFCHFCDADGLHHYYDSYDYLRKHFRDEHYLCEEGDCAEEQFTSVFRTDIDLRAHKANIHGKHLSKAAAKQARTLELEFTLAPRADPRGRRGGHPGAPRPSREHTGHYGEGRSFHPHREPSPPPSEPMFEQQPLVDVQSTQEFPRLGNASASTPMPNLGQSKGRGGFNKYGNLRKGNYDQNFPALGTESAATPPVLPKTLNFSACSTNKTTNANSGRQTGAAAKSSTQVNHRPNGMTRLGGGASLRLRAGPSRDSDFPALGGSNQSEPMAGPCNQSWTKVSCVKPPPQPRNTPAPLASSPPPLRSGQDFPSLSKPSKPGKSTGQTTSNTPSTWLQSIDTNNSSLTGDATKGKAKKKKMKQQTTNIGNNSPKTMNATTKPEQTEVKPKIKPKLSEAEIEEKSSVVPGAAERKRSDLKVENLNTKNNNLSSEVNTTSNASRAEDFPAVGRSGSRPPGLMSPPPGFGGSVTTIPPPGFLSRLNGLTFTNSSGESYTIVPDELKEPEQRCYEYHPPNGFQQRNQNLIAKFHDCFGLEDSAEFKAFCHLSRLFRSGACNASTYYEQCQTAMGKHSFNRLFPELLALLPDIDKQRELYDVHKRKVNSDAARAVDLTECANCGQILLSTDLQSHATSHSLENHFPALGKSISSSTTWSRK